MIFHHILLFRHTNYPHVYDVTEHPLTIAKWTVTNQTLLSPMCSVIRCGCVLGNPFHHIQIPTDQENKSEIQILLTLLQTCGVKHLIQWTWAKHMKYFWIIFNKYHNNFFFYISVSMHHKSVIYNKPTRCNSGSIVFINNYKYALHVSDALCVHHQEHYKL